MLAFTKLMTISQNRFPKTERFSSLGDKDRHKWITKLSQHNRIAPITQSQRVVPETALFHGKF